MLLLGSYFLDMQGSARGRTCWPKEGPARLPREMLLNLGRGARPACGDGEGQSCGRCRGPHEELEQAAAPPCLGAGQARPDGEDEVPLLSDRTPASGLLPAWAPAPCLPVGLARSPPGRPLPLSTLRNLYS